MRVLRGNAALIATDRATGEESVFRLPSPLRLGTPRRVEARFFEESLDRRTVNVVTVGDPVYEVTARARFVGRPQVWMDLIAKAANQQHALAYVHDLDRPTSYDVVAIHPDDAVAMELDSDRSIFGEYEATVVLRSTSPFVGLLGTKGLVIAWEGGQSLDGWTFARTSTGMARGRDGAIRSFGAGVPRTTWRRDASGLLVPATLLEPGATNYASSTSVTGGESGLWEWTMPAPGRYRLTALVDAPAHASNYPGIIGPYAAAADEAVTLSTWIATGSSPHLEIRANGFSGSTPDTRADGRQVITITHGAPWVHSLAVYAPAGVRADIRAGDYIELVLPQIEATPYATSPILTDGAPEDRSRDTLYLDLPDEVATPGAPLAIYARYLMGADPMSFASTVGAWGITNPGDAAPRLVQLISANNGRLQLAHRNDTSPTSVTTAVGSALQAGDLLESLVLVWTEIIDGRRMLVGRLIARVLPAGSSQWGPIESAPLPPLEPAPEWSARRLYIGSRGTAPGVYEWESLKVYAGRLSGSDTETMDFMRRAY